MTIEETAKEVVQQYIEPFNQALLAKLENLIAEGNIAAVRYTKTGTISKRCGAKDAASQAKQLGITSP